MTDKMTNRDFYTAITSNETLSDEIREFAAAQIVKLDAANAKRREKADLASSENAKYVQTLIALLNKTPKTGEQLVAELAEAGVTEINGKTVTKQKVATMLRGAVAEGAVTKTKVKAEKSTVVGYVVAE